MALTTKPKPTIHHKKSRAKHHRHSKVYLKPYWPYLPMLVIMGAGLAANRWWAVPASRAGSDYVGAGNGNLAAAEPLTRAQLLVGTRSDWLVGLIIIISVLAFGLFAFRHGRRLQHSVSHGERFISDHPWLDIITVFVFTAGIVLTRTGGLGH